MATHDQDPHCAAQSSAAYYLPHLERAVDAVLGAPCSTRGSALAELSLLLGLVEERLVESVKAGGKAESGSSLNGGSVLPPLDFAGEVPTLMARLRADACATVQPAGQQGVGVAAPRATVAAVASMLWRRGGAKDNNNTAHLQTALSFLRSGELDCFGLATTTLIAIALLLEDAELCETDHPLTTLSVQLSEDHCWLQWIDSGGSPCTAEIAVAKNKVTLAAEVTEEARRAWLYLGGRHVSCTSTARLVCAMLHNINPECRPKKQDSVALSAIKLALLRRVRVREPAAIYPGCLCELGDQLDVAEMQDLEGAGLARVGAAANAAAATAAAAVEVEMAVREIVEGISVAPSLCALEEVRRSPVSTLRTARPLLFSPCPLTNYIGLLFSQALALSLAAPYGGWMVYPHSFVSGWQLRRTKYLCKLIDVLTCGQNTAQCCLRAVVERVVAARATHALLCLRSYANMCATASRYTCSKKDDQLVKEVDGAVSNVRFCCECCHTLTSDGIRDTLEPLRHLIDSLCKWEEGGMRIMDKWAKRIVTLVCSSVLRPEDRQQMDALSSYRSRKMRRLASQGLWSKLPRSRATVLLLLEGDTVADDGDVAGDGGGLVGGRSKRRRVAKARD
jgi:hypothetical protein